MTIRSRRPVKHLKGRFYVGINPDGSYYIAGRAEEHSNGFISSRLHSIDFTTGIIVTQHTIYLTDPCYPIPTEN